ncbi:MAG: metallophosphoesterase family protein, partial [Verrucomicrobia bacterium]|nr:metallophosphoesterase family protein [Verrucomicrobiota bacterium]
MRYAVFSDIHANLQAWDAVIKDIRELEADVLVCLGDVIGYGPKPEQVLTAIRAVTQNFVIGNHDAAAVGVYINSDLFNPQAKEAIEWTSDQLSDESKSFLANTPLTLETEEILFVHAEISEPSRFGYIADIQSAAENLASNDHFLTFIGHTHHPIIFDLDPNGETQALPDEDGQLQEGHRYVVNVGSVGEPRNPDDARARYVIYDTETRELYFRRIAFDHGAYRNDLATSGLGVVPFFLRVLDHSALLDQEMLREVEQEMQTPAVWDPNTRSIDTNTKQLLDTGESQSANTEKPKPKPLPAQTKRKLSKVTALVILLLLLIIVGGVGIFQKYMRYKAQSQLADSPAIVPVETSPELAPPPEPSVATKDKPSPEPAPKKQDPKPKPTSSVKPTPPAT